MTEVSVFLPDEAATQSVGHLLANCLQAPLAVGMVGPLGAGKSSLVRAVLRALGVQGPIKSPSYALVEPYTFSNYSLYHFDFYRFFDQNEWEDSGFRDYFNAQSICVVEWPDKAGGVLPPLDLEISMAYANEGTVDGRRCTVSAKSSAGQEVIEKLKAAL